MRRHRSQHPSSRNSAFRCNGGGYLQPQIPGSAHEESARRHLIYLRDGQAEVVGLFPVPLTALPDQISYLHYVTQTVQNALKRMAELYFRDFDVREVLRIPPDEEAWLLECWGPSQRENNPIFGRLDAVVQAAFER